MSHQQLHVQCPTNTWQIPTFTNILCYHPHYLQGGPRKCNIDFWYGQNASFRNSATRDRWERKVVYAVLYRSKPKNVMLHVWAFIVSKSTRHAWNKHVAFKKQKCNMSSWGHGHVKHFFLLCRRQVIHNHPCNVHSNWTMIEKLSLHLQWDDLQKPGTSMAKHDYSNHFLQNYAKLKHSHDGRIPELDPAPYILAYVCASQIAGSRYTGRNCKMAMEVPGEAIFFDPSLQSSFLTLLSSLCPRKCIGPSVINLFAQAICVGRVGSNWLCIIRVISVIYHHECGWGSMRFCVEAWLFRFHVGGPAAFGFAAAQPTAPGIGGNEEDRNLGRCTQRRIAQTRLRKTWKRQGTHTHTHTHTHHTKKSYQSLAIYFSF